MTIESWKQRQADIEVQRQLSAPKPAPQSRAAELPYGRVRRVTYGLWWSFVATVLVLGGFAAVFGGEAGAALLVLALGALAARYAYRIWTWQARSLWFVIFF
jgi:hypothetical protein